MHDLEFVGDYRNPQPLTARQRELGFDGSSAGEFTFGDFLDIINPLQHIPIVSTLYREITGDEISPHARIFGDTLFGGPTGLLTAAAAVLYEEIAGEDIGETVLALFSDEPQDDERQFAGSDAAPGDPAADPLGAAMVAPAGEPGAPLVTAAGPAPAGSQPVPMPVMPAPEVALTATGGPGMLTGQDALNALFSDLRPAGPRPLAKVEAREALPLPGRQGAAEAKSYPLPPRPPRAAEPPAAKAMPSPAAPQASADHPLIFAGNVPEADLARRMMQALDRYGAMARERREDRPRSPEETLWQSDPAAGGDT